MHKQALLILVLALGAPGGASAWGDGVRGARRYMAAARQGGDPAAKPQPRLVVPHANQKLPPIREGKVLPVVFRLENRGQADLLIHSAKSSCGCTTVSLTKDQKRIPPGGHVDLKVRFNSLGRPGVQNKSVTIQTNDPQAARAVLRFRVEVRTLFRTVPGQKYILGNARRGEKLAKPLDLLPTGEDMELEVMSVEVPKGVFRYEASALPVKNAVGQRLRLTVNEYAPLGPVSGMIDIKVRVADEEETRQLRVVGAILGDVVVSPERIRLDRPSVRGIYLRPVELASVSGQPFEVFEATAGPSLETEIEPNDDKSRYTIKIRIAEDAVDGPLGTLVNIRTNSPLQPIVHVPVFAFVAPRVKIDPPIVLLGTKTGDASLHRAVFLKNPALENFAILDVSVDKDYVEAKVVDRPDAPTGFRYLDIALPQTARPDQARATVTIKTDLPGAETLSLPVLIGRADQDIGNGGSEK